MGTYYVVVEEWNYPTESGHEAVLGTCASAEDAIRLCLNLAEGEMANFRRNVNEDFLPAAVCCNGAILTTRMGLDPYYYYARYIAVPPIDRALVMLVNARAK